jgi:hypothetical protein
MSPAVALAMVLIAAGPRWAQGWADNPDPPPSPVRASTGWADDPGGEFARSPLPDRYRREAPAAPDPGARRPDAGKRAPERSAASKGPITPPASQKRPGASNPVPLADLSRKPVPDPGPITPALRWIEYGPSWLLGYDDPVAGRFLYLKVVPRVANWPPLLAP